MDGLTILVLFAATGLTGILTGASLDQSIKQLPARHKIGSITFSKYARAADLGNGIIWYAVMGISSALFTLAAAVLILQSNPASQELSGSVLVAGALAIAHSLATSQAAPTYYSQRKVANDESALIDVFKRFEFWQTIRAVLQTLNFVVLLYAVYLYLS